MLRVGIVEDEKGCRAALRRDIERFAGEQQVSLEITEFSNGLELLEGYRPVWDLLLLDIEMPLLDGMEAARRVRAQDSGVLIIFVTNMARYAINGYEVGALDFVLKPVTYPQLSMKLHKAFALKAGQAERWLLVEAGGLVRRVPAAEVISIQVWDHQLAICTETARYTQRGSLREMEKKLEGLPFCRCNQSCLVNLRHVREMTRDTVLAGGDKLPLSRSCKKEFLQKLSDHLGGGGR